MLPIERKKLLFLQRQMAHPRAYPWIDAQLAKLADVFLDPDWQAAVLNDQKLPEIRRKLKRLRGP
jgi:hypothetical protein